ncbi:MAG: TolC family protein [Bryobacteraceae bacterium]
MFIGAGDFRTFFGVAAVMLSVVAIAAPQGALLEAGNPKPSGPFRMTLPVAQDRAAAASKVAELAKLSVDQARYRRLGAQADFFPKIGAIFANMHFNKFMGERIQVLGRTAQLPLLNTDESLFAVTAAQPVTQLFKVREAVNIARADERIAQAKAAAMSAQLKSDVELAFFKLLIAQRQQAAGAKAKGNRDLMQVASAAPMPLSASVERRLAILEAEKELVTANSQAAGLTQALNTLIGLPLDTQLELSAPEPLMETVSAQAVQQSIDRNPEVVEARETVVKARAATKLAKLEYIPDVTAMFTYSYQTAVPLLPRDFSFYGVLASWNVFDFGKRERLVSERRTQLQLAEANLEIVKAKIGASIQKSLLELQRAGRIRELTRKVATMSRSVHISNVAAATESGETLSQADVEMFQAELDYRLAYAQLKRMAGEK